MSELDHEKLVLDMGGSSSLGGFGGSSGGFGGSSGGFGGSSGGFGDSSGGFGGSSGGFGGSSGSFDCSSGAPVHVFTQQDVNVSHLGQVPLQGEPRFLARAVMFYFVEIFFL